MNLIFERGTLTLSMSAYSKVIGCQSLQSKIIMQGFIVPHLKDLIHICLELGDQDPSKTLKITYALLNSPYFTS